MQDHDTPSQSGTRESKPSPQTCKQCGQEFSPKGGTTGFFCSRDCYWTWRRKTGLRGFSQLQGSQFMDARSRCSTKGTERERFLFQHPEEDSTDLTDDDLLWAERGRYWGSQADAASVDKNPVRLEERKALVLSGHGVGLRVDHGALLIRHGFTHYPQRRRERRFFPGDHKLPSRIILLSTDGSVTLDVTRWLSEQNVPLVILDYRGEVVNVLGNETTASDLRLRRAQIEGLDNGVGLQVACGLIERKLENSLATLGTLRKSEERSFAFKVIGDGLKQLRQAPPATPDELRWLEGLSAVAYFAAWRSIAVTWKRTAKHPIPSEWQQIGTRSDLLSTRNRHARHPVNAMLNYGYAVLESQVRIACARLGLDPTIGYLHSNRSGRQALIYDLMEPSRPEVDRAILEIVRTTVFEPGDFTMDNRGACRLHPELARRIASAQHGSEPFRIISKAMRLLRD